MSDDDREIDRQAIIRGVKLFRAEFLNDTTAFDQIFDDMFIAGDRAATLANIHALIEFLVGMATRYMTNPPVPMPLPDYMDWILKETESYE